MKTKSLLIATVSFAIAHSANAQLDLSQISGANYFQNFDAIGTSLPTGWSVYSTATSSALGTSAAFGIAKTSWASSSGGFWNYASITNNDGSTLASNATVTVQSAVTNRVVGIRQTSSLDPGAAVVLEVAATTNGSNFAISFDWLMLNNQGRSTVWNLDYGIGASPTLFTKIASWTNGGMFPNQWSTNFFGTTNLSFSFGSALDNQSQPVWIRIVALAATTGGGSRCSFGLDNFNLSWSPPSTITNPPVISSQPQGVTNNATSTVSFSVNPGNTTTPSYQWYEVVGGVTNQLTDGASPSGDGSSTIGSSGPTLTIANVLGGEAGFYFVIITNGVGVTNSGRVALRVNDPIISAQPTSMTNVFNDVDFFSATALGTPGGRLRWYYGGNVISNVDFSGITNATSIFTVNDFAATNWSGYYLVASNQFGTATSAVVTANIALTPAVAIARWDFNDTNDYTATNALPVIGSGTAVPVQNPAVTNFIFAIGSLSDPNQLIAGTTNQSWELNGFAAGISNKTAGFQFNVSTAGYTNIVLTWSERHSSTASKYMRVQYTTNGTDFLDGDVIAFNQVGYQFYSSDLSTKVGVANNPDFGFRLVAEWESTAIGDANNAYAGTTSSFGGGGTIRLDLMTVFGSVIGAGQIPLFIRIAGTNAVLSWTDSANKFGLQSALQLAGPYSNLSGAYTNSPFTNPITGAQQFFRLKSN